MNEYEDVTCLQYMLNSQSISISQKWKMWKEHKEEQFRKMASDPSQMFNYFYTNNDILNFIQKPDMILYTVAARDMVEKRTYTLLGSIATVLLVDKIVLNRFFPRIRFKKWRLTANLIKFIVWPMAIAQPIQYALTRSDRSVISNVQQLYSFGFQDYVRANKIFERALNANRLEELIEKRDKFDWSGVPQLQE